MTRKSLSLLTKSAFLICCFVLTLASFAQTKSNKGKEFWLGYMKHDSDLGAGMSLYITSDSNTSGTVSIPGQSWSQNFSVTANNTTVINIPQSKAYLDCSDCIESKGVKVVANDNIVVYSHHYEGNRSDATLVLPTRTLGKEYYLMAYEQRSSGNAGRSTFAMVAIKDNTKIKITPACDLRKNGGGTLDKGKTYQITLDEGEVYSAYAASGTSTYDVTGTFVEVIDTGATADCRTIAVYSGSSYARVGNCSGSWPYFNSADNLYEQMFPTNSWGKRFVLVPALGRSSDNFRFLAKNDKTQIIVYKSGGAPDILNLDAGEYEDVKDVDVTRMVISNQPIMAAQFQKTSLCDGRNRTGDPSMTILNPLEQTLSDITLYSSDYYDIDNHYINIVIPSKDKNSFKLDGKTVSWSSVPFFSSYSYARESVSKGNHRLTASGGFIANAYGEGQYESYGYAAGANVKDLRAQIDVSNSTKTDELSNCLGTATAFKGTAEYTVNKWEWDFGDGNTDTVQNPSHTYADTGTYKVRLYTYKPQYDGCSNYDSAFVDVNIYDKPTARIVAENLCDSSTARFLDSSIIPSPEQWNLTTFYIDGGPAIYSRAVNRYYDTVGKHEVRMVISTRNSCSDEVTDSFTISPKPNAQFEVDDICFRDYAFFMDLSTVTTGAVTTYDWRFGDGDSSDTKDPVKYYNTSEKFPVTLTATTDSGCSRTFTDSVYKYPNFQAKYSFRDTCIGSQSLFKNTSIIEGGNFTDTTWYTSENDTFKTFDLNKTFASEGTYEVQLIMEQDSFCSDTFKQFVNINPYAIVDFDVSNLCLGDSATFTDKSNVSVGSYTVNWDFDDGITGDSTFEKIYYTTSGTKDIKLEVTTSTGCTSELSESIKVTNPIITSITANDFCSNEVLELSASHTLDQDSIVTYEWFINGVSASTRDTFDYTPLSPGKKYVDLINTTENGCTISYSDSLEVFHSPSANFFVTNVCNTHDVIPTDNSSIDPSSSISTYQWYLNNSLIGSTQNLSFTASNVGVNDLKLQVVSKDGCRDTIVKSFETYPLPAVDYAIGATCLGENTILNDNSTIASGTNTSYTWFFDDGTSQTGISANKIFAAVGTYDVKEIVESDQGCSDSTTKQVVINPLPVLDITVDNYEGCEPYTPTFTNNSSITSGSISSYNWNMGDGNTTSGTSPSYTYSNVGTYTVKVVGVSDMGCIDSMTLPTAFTINARPKADFTFSPKEPSLLTSDVDFKDSSSADAMTWDWVFSDGTTLAGQQVKHSFQDSGLFAIELKISNANGCRDSITKNIYVNADLFVHIPTGFSPNNDGVNETWGLSGLTQGVVDLELTIYNKWGEQIFLTNDVNAKWDGTYKGKPVQQGVYLYMMKFTNPKQSEWFYRHGTVNLLR